MREKGGGGVTVAGAGAVAGGWINRYFGEGVEHKVHTFDVLS